jgi:uncharacterized protein with PIN domain
MVIDASALLAILLDEPARARIEAAIAANTLRLVSSVSKLSAALKLTGRHGPDAPARLDRLLSEINASVVPWPACRGARLVGLRGLRARGQRSGAAAICRRGVGADGCGGGHRKKSLDTVTLLR